MNNDRLTYNRLILATLIRLSEENPDMRFGQLLMNFGVLAEVTRDYFIESEAAFNMLEATEKRINARLKEKK